MRITEEMTVINGRDEFELAAKMIVHDCRMKRAIQRALPPAEVMVLLNVLPPYPEMGLHDMIERERIARSFREAGIVSY